MKKELLGEPKKTLDQFIQGIRARARRNKSQFQADGRYEQKNALKYRDKKKKRKFRFV